MTKVFISYRREDSKWQADRLYKQLRALNTEPRLEVFIDIDSMPLGKDFVAHIRKRVAECDVLLAVIGDKWLDVRNPTTGQRRLDDPSDFVRLEIASALQGDVSVVPIMLDGTAFPKASDLPDTMQSLVTRAGVEVRHLSFDDDVERLVRRLGVVRILDQPAPVRKSRPLRWFWLLLLVPVLAAAAFAVALWPRPAMSPAAVYEFVNQNSLSDLRRFIAAYPESIEAKRASNQLAELDNASWREARAAGTITAFRQYLDEFPSTAQPPGLEATRAQNYIDDHSRSISAIQQALIAKHLLLGTPNGVLDESTQSATSLFGEVTETEPPQLDAWAPDTMSRFAVRIQDWDGKPAESYTQPIVPVSQGDQRCVVQPGPFDIYFEVDADRLTPNNQELILSAVSRARTGGCTITIATIETSRGSARAGMVRDGLIAAGVNADAIHLDDTATPELSKLDSALGPLRWVRVTMTIGR